MEPMMIGSNNNSMNASLLDTSSTQNPHFLPSFLLGSDGDDSGRPSFTSHKPQVSETPNKFFTSPENTLTGRVQSNNEKQEGPPTISLADYSIASPLSPASMSNNISHHNHANFANMSHGDEDLSDNWVTVYGFGANQLDSVLAHFAHIGRVIEKHRSIGDGNWLHLKFANKRDMNMALAQNGKQILSNLMIGVQPRKDKTILKNITNSSNPTRSKIQMDSSLYVKPQTQYYTAASPSFRRMGVSGGIENEVISPMNNVPTKSSGVVAKAMEYIFGW